MKNEKIINFFLCYVVPTTYILSVLGYLNTIAYAICTLNYQYFACYIQNCADTNTEAILACTLRAWGYEWKFCCGGSMTLKCCTEPWFYMPDQVGCRLSVGEVQKKFARAIFGVADNISEYAIFQMAARISAALGIKLPEGQPAVLHKLIHCSN